MKFKKFVINYQKINAGNKTVIAAMCLLAAGLGSIAFKPDIVQAQTYDTTGLSSIQLLNDPTFSNGIQMSVGTYPAIATCQANWSVRVPELNNASWRLVEVGEKALFCNQSSNPTGGTTITYTNPTDRDVLAGSKQIVDYKNTVNGVNMIFDSSKEWRGGCSLAKNDELNGNASPVYGANNGAWDWQHLFLAQSIKDRDGGRLMMNRYKRLIFDATLEVGKSTKVATPYAPNGKCPDWINNNQALLYVAMVLDDATDPSNQSKRMYVIFPAWMTYDGSTYASNAGWLGGDPAGAKVYYTGLLKSGGKYSPLSVGSEHTYSIDLQELAIEAIGASNQKYFSSWNIDNYFIQEMYIGWEIWGGYDTNVTIRNPSLEAYSECIPKTCSSLNYDCGPVSDGCGAMLSCGSCASNQVCISGQCVANCVSKTCSTLGNYTCGSWSDGCATTINCGTCITGQTCSNGQCVVSGRGGGGGVTTPPATPLVISKLVTPMNRADILAKIAQIKILLIQLIQQLVTELQKQLPVINP